jgi:hypothetical protein
LSTTEAKEADRRTVWTEERKKTEIIQFLFKKSVPQTFYEIREGIEVPDDEGGFYNVSVLPTLAKLRAEEIVWREDKHDGTSIRYALALSVWLKMAEKAQAAKKVVGVA